MSDPKHIKRIDLACGQNKQKDFEGVDIFPLDGVDHVVDLFSDRWYCSKHDSLLLTCIAGGIGEVWCSHFVEHVPDLVLFMNQVWNHCLNGAKVTIVHPHQNSLRAWQDPTHVRALNEYSWNYYNQKWLKDNGLSHYPIVANFDIVSTQYLPSEYFQDKPLGSIKDATLHHAVNVIADLVVTLKALP